MHASEITITLKCDSQIKKLKRKVKMEKKIKKIKSQICPKKILGLSLKVKNEIFFFLLLACLFMCLFIYFGTLVTREISG